MAWQRCRIHCKEENEPQLSEKWYGFCQSMGIRKREQSGEKRRGKRDGSGDKAADRDIKKREGCRDSGTLLRRWRSAGDCRLCGRFVLSGGAGDDGAAEDDHFLWRVIYGRECEDFKPGEDGYHGRPERGLSDGSHG